MGLNGRSLGGYGAISVEAMPRTGDGPLIPYAGGFAGFIPYRMGGGGALAFRSRRTTAMQPVRSSFNLTSASGGMGSSMGSDSRLSLTSGPRGGKGAADRRDGAQLRNATRDDSTVQHGRHATEFRLPVPSAAKAGIVRWGDVYADAIGRTRRGPDDAIPWPVRNHHPEGPERDRRRVRDGLGAR